MTNELAGKSVVRVHLITGEVVESNADEVTPEQREQFSEFMADLMKAAPDEGWRISIELHGGGSAWFPRSSVLYVEMTPEAQF